MLGLDKWFSKKPIKEWTVLDDCKAPTPRLNGGPWIIGGAALEFVQTRDFKHSRDIDYFFRSYSQMSRYEKKFKKIKGAKYETGGRYSMDPSAYGNSNYYVILGGHKFNLIGFGFAASAEIIADSFDFTVCQVWTDGRIYECSHRTRHDIEHKVLSFTKTQQNVDLVKSDVQIIDEHNELKIKALEKRIRKYRDKGFEPDEYMVEWILRYL